VTATISIAGHLAAVDAGGVNIIYTSPIGCSVYQFLEVVTSPPAIVGSPTVCIASSSEDIDIGGGTWSTSDPSIVTIDSVSGSMGAIVNITGVSVGSATITYETGSLCMATQTVTVTPATCTGTPVAGTATTTSAWVCIGAPIYLSLSGASVGCGITYQWQCSLDDITWTDIPGSNALPFTYAPVISQLYRCKATCIATGLFSYSTVIYVTANSNIAADILSDPIDTACNALDFYISACGSSDSFNVTTWYGDGTWENLPLSSTGIRHADFLHSYSTPGTYEVRQVLYAGSVTQDSVQFSYEYLHCRYLPIGFYFDISSDCVFDSGDKQLLLPVTTEVDSNGVAIDTISATSGYYYKALGAAGTVYRFRVVSAPDGLHAVCPLAGTIYDTIQAYVNNYHEKYIGFSCTAGGSFDLAEHVSTRTGRHMQTGTIITDNSYCTPVNATLTLIFSPQYIFGSASPAPTSVTGNVATWDLSALSLVLAAYPVINYTLEVPTTWLIPGDTVHSNCAIRAVIPGDLDTTNNISIWTDTVKSSYDPNEMSVTPQGNVPSCTKLKYTVNFENTGNDTAHNISVMDTLSDNLDPHTLNIEIASSVMNIAIINDGVHNIVKFDFQASTF